MTRTDPTQSEDSIRVLHVDDELNQVEFAKTFIEFSDRTIHMEAVTSPKKALERLRDESFDCIISDYQMPGMDGIEFARRIRETSDVPIIIYTGRGSEGVAEAAFAAGVDDYLRKETNPSHYQVLAKRIRIAVEKHRAERALQHQLDDIQLIFDTMPATIWFKDTENNILRINKAAAEPVGLTVEEEEGKSVYDLFPGEAEKYYQDDLEVITTGKPKTGIVEEPQPHSGDRMWVRTDKVPIFDDEGGITGLLTFVVDSSEIKRRKDELRAREEDLTLERDLMQVLFEQSPDFIYFKDSKARFHRASKRFTDLLGLNLAEILGKKDMQLFPEEVATQTLKDDLRVIETGRPVINKEEYSAGTWVLTSKIPWVDKEGNIIGLFGISRDITERKRMEEETKQYQIRLESLHLHATKLTLAKTVEEVSQVTLRTMAEVLGFEHQSFQTLKDGVLTTRGSLGAPLMNIPLPNEGEGVTAKAVREARSILLNGVREGPDFVKGSAASLSELAVPAMSEGKIVAVLNVESLRLNAFTEQDCTLLELLAHHVASTLGRIRRINELEKAAESRELAERELVAYMETLSDAVEEKTREKLDLERMSAAGKIAAMVGHDMRGPLQTIKNALYLMERNPEMGAEFKETMNEAVDYAASMLEELRLNVGDSPLKLQEVSLKSLIRRAVDEATIPDSVETEIHFDEGLDSSSMDPLKIRRVLDNLVRNAVEAMPDGGVLRVLAIEEGNAVSIRVRDTGMGIPEDLMPDLFKAFVTTKPQGLGLGLAYCKRAVEAHGGTIVVESKLGEGTTFIVEIPTGTSGTT